MGDMLTDVQRTEDLLIIQKPDWIDEEANPYHGEVPLESEQPFHFRDPNGVPTEMFIVAKRGEDMDVVSASSIVNKLPARFDPLPANPKKVGRFYIGWGIGKSGGLSSLVQTTAGKVLIIGSALFMGYLLGVLTIAWHVGHF